MLIAVEIKTIMSVNPKTLSSKTSVANAIKFLEENHFRHVPIVNATGEVEGLLSIRSLVDFIAEHLPGYVLNLPPNDAFISKEPAGG